MNFGKYAILQPVTYYFRREPSLWWKFKPPTSGDELSMARYLNRGKLTLSADGPSREVPPSWIEVAHREIALIFAGTNITKSEKSLEEGGEAILTVGMEPEEIEAILRLMPHEMVMEIWAAIGEHVPGWGGPPLEPLAEDEAELPNSESREEEVS